MAVFCKLNEMKFIIYLLLFVRFAAAHECLFKTDLLTVYYPDAPRVPNHLTVAFNRDVHGLCDVSEEENAALFATIKKMAEIYKSIGIRGFVIARYDAPQAVEIIPHLPGFENIKHIVDKVDCHRYVLYRQSPLIPVVYGKIESNADFWREAFQKDYPALTADDIAIELPNRRYEAYWDEARELMQMYRLELQGEKGTPMAMPLEIPEHLPEVNIPKCYFCDPKVLEKQTVFEHEGIVVLNNLKKGPKPGCTFLIFPKRHIEKVYGLLPEEIHQISIVRKALIEVLKEFHPGQDVVVFVQDHPSSGQTVFHTHEQVVSIDPANALSWVSTYLSSSNISDEEMAQVTEEFGKKMMDKF